MCNIMYAVQGKIYTNHENYQQRQCANYDDARLFKLSRTKRLEKIPLTKMRRCVTRTTWTQSSSTFPGEKPNDAGCCSEERSPFATASQRQERTATPIPSSRSDDLPTQSESDASLPGLETAPSRAVAGSHLLPTRWAEDKSQLSVDLLVALLFLWELLGNPLQRDSDWSLLIVLRVKQREGESGDRSFQVWTYGGLATSTANIRKCQCERHTAT